MWDLVVLIPDYCLSCSFKSVKNSLIRIQELSGGKGVSISDIFRTRWQVADEQFEVRLTEMYFILFDGKSDFVLSVCQDIRILDKIHNKRYLKDCLPHLFHGFRNKYFNRISFDNNLYFHY